MKNIWERFIKATIDGDVFYEDVKRTQVHDLDRMETETTRRMWHCPTCGNPLEENIVRRNCRVCGGPCCNFCHTERINSEKRMFEQEMRLIQERRKLLESKALDGFPLIKWIRRITSYNDMRRLEDRRRQS